MPQSRILIVEDEIKIAQLLKEYLEKSGFVAECRTSGAGLEDTVRRAPPALILLDLMLPDADGIELCRNIRHFSPVPIIMITARVDEVDRVVGLEIGADDYICKPFSPREVVARVQAVLRRVQPPTGEKTISTGPLYMNVNEHWVKIDDKLLELTPNEFGLLKVLMKQPNRVFTRSDLVLQVQGYEYDGYERTIDTHIKNLRRKIRAFWPKELIITVYGLGYKLKQQA